jgi:hypothetical protein
MRKLGISKHTTLLVVAGLGTAVTGWGGITSCPVTSGAAASLASLGTDSNGSGCSSIDLSFTNLNVTGATSSTGNGSDGTNNVTTPSTGNIDIYSTGTAASGNTVGPVALYIEGFGSITNGSLGSPNKETGTVDVVATANTGGAGYGAAPANSGLHWDFTSLEFNPTPLQIQNMETVVITETFCLDATSATVGSGGCAAANQGTITATFTNNTTPVFTCTFDGSSAGACGGTASNTVTFSNLSFDPTSIAIADAVSISVNNGTFIPGSTFIENVFDEGAVAPEPATFGLMSVALAGLAAFGYRKRCQRS